jgi:hypothetical protein
MKCFLQITIIICLCHSAFLPSYSQRHYKRFTYIDGFSINATVGITSVTGELGDFFTMNPFINLGIEKGVSEKISLKLDIEGGNLSGFENFPYSEKFKTDFFQLTLFSYFNLNRFVVDNYKKSRWEWKPYIGVGQIWFHTDVYDLKLNSFLRTTADGTTKHTTIFQQAGIGIGEAGIYYTRELVIPLGIIANYRLSSRIDTKFNLGYSFVNNDKLDGTTSYNLKNRTIIGGANSYSETANDGRVNLSIGIRYKFASLKIENQRGI